jgi:hypothetical protein
MAWLNRNEMGGTWTTKLQRDLMEEGTYRWNEWAKAHDVRVHQYLDTIHQGQEGRPSLNEWAARRGKVRMARGGRGTYATTAHGAIPWYVPEGAEWDMEAERSTKQWAWNSKSGYNIETLEHVSWEEMRQYHEDADTLYQEELEGWDHLDHAPMRRACAYYDTGLDTYLIIPSSDAYIEDGLTKGTNAAHDAQDAAFHGEQLGFSPYHHRWKAAASAKRQHVPVQQVASDPLDQLLDWLEGGWVT